MREDLLCNAADCNDLVEELKLCRWTWLIRLAKVAQTVLPILIKLNLKQRMCVTEVVLVRL